MAGKLDQGRLRRAVVKGAGLLRLRINPRIWRNVRVHRRDVDDTCAIRCGKRRAGGTDSFEGTGCFSDCPVSLNDFGAVTGIYIDSNFVYHGYLRTPDGKITTVDPPGSTGTLPYGINDSGAITGYFFDANNVVHGFVAIHGR